MSTDPAHPHVLLGTRRTVRIIRVRRGKFLEFEFSVDHEDLTVELVMPWPELVEFAATNDAVWLAPAAEAWDEVRRLAARHGDEAVLSAMERAAAAQPTNPTAGGQP